MEVTTSTAVAQPPSGSPYQLDKTQTSKACKVLLQHIDEKRRDRISKSEKVNLLAEDAGSGEDGADEGNDTPIWAVISTKKHVSDKKKLKPSKIRIPHPLNTDTNSTICLITSDPQRLYKDQIADPAFPAALRSRITRVIGLQKLKAKYKPFEARRQLAAEHDIFLADSRIVTHLPGILGKTFFKGNNKRPIPVNIAGPSERTADGKRIKQVPGAVRHSTKSEIGKGASTPAQIAKEVEKALSCAVVHISTSATTSVKVARAAFTPEHCVENIEAVMQAMTDKLVPQGWRNIRAIHIKGPNTMAFPIWLASELWVEERDVLDQRKVQGKKPKKNLPSKRSNLLQNAPDGAHPAVTRERVDKRKADETSKPDAAKHAKKKRKAGIENDGDADVAATKQLLQDQKLAAMAEVE